MDENVRGGDEWLFSAVLDKGIGDNFHLFTKGETISQHRHGYLQHSMKLWKSSRTS